MKEWASQRPVFTVTGRIRARTPFCASRNTLFQGPAADGTVLGLWLLWRRGYKLVSAIHDQMVVECPADDRVLKSKEDIEQLMIEGMRTVIPGMLVKVESVISRSLDKSELDARYYLKKEDRRRQSADRTPGKDPRPLRNEQETSQRTAEVGPHLKRV